MNKITQTPVGADLSHTPPIMLMNKSVGADLSALAGLSRYPVYFVKIHYRSQSTSNKATPFACHPEPQRRISLAGAEMLHCTQHDTSLPNCGAYASTQFYIMLSKPASAQLAFLQPHRVCHWVYPAKAHPPLRQPTYRVSPRSAVACQQWSWHQEVQA